MATRQEDFNDTPFSLLCVKAVVGGKSSFRFEKGTSVRITFVPICNSNHSSYRFDMLAGWLDFSPCS